MLGLIKREGSSLLGTAERAARPLPGLVKRAISSFLGITERKASSHQSAVSTHHKTCRVEHVYEENE